MFETKKVISKAEQDKKKLENQEKFILWLQKMNNTHQANAPRMHRALENIL
jgi:hypothetical protein